MDMKFIEIQKLFLANFQFYFVLCKIKASTQVSIRSEYSSLISEIWTVLFLWVSLGNDLIQGKFYVVVLLLDFSGSGFTSSYCILSSHFTRLAEAAQLQLNLI